MTSPETGTSVDSFEALSRRQRRRLVVSATLRTLATIAAVVLIYYLVPMDHEMNGPTIAELALGALVFVAVVGWQVWRISRSDYPTIRAVESLAFTIPVYVLLFAAVYFLMDHANAASFGTYLTRTDTLYFSVTVFTTVGFGDISAKSEAARALVTCQMLLDLLILGLVVRLVVNAIKVGQKRHAG